MKACPQCGYIDRSHWRQNKWRTNVEFLKHLDYPEDIEPRILEELNAGHPVALDKLYAYQHCGEVIERILRVDYEVGGRKAFHIPREKPRQEDPQQVKIA